MTFGIFTIAISTALAYFLDVAKAWGAHPFWATQVIFVGAAIALVLFLVPMFRPALKLILLIALSLVSFAIATYGKTQFAASYAEDALAGQLWYFGWHAVFAFGFAAIGMAVKVAVSLGRSRP